MQVIAARDITKADGDVRWQKGSIVDYPKDTLAQIAKSVGTSFNRLFKPLTQENMTKRLKEEGNTVDG